jgi:hypothetical protein
MHVFSEHQVSIPETQIRFSSSRFETALRHHASVNSIEKSGDWENIVAESTIREHSLEMTKHEKVHCDSCTATIERDN